jgi:predicted house-cleaning noncanonical NTP pyrophosphatase (MazG superfamily)
LPNYNKLVRDLIPNVIKRTGKGFTTRVLDESEYIIELKKKAFEELEEYMDAKEYKEVIEELADMLEIIHAFAEFHGSSIEEVEAVRKQKAKDRGRFQEKIYLMEVEE